MMDNRCTAWFNGGWLECCVWHDISSEEAQHFKSAEMRLKADRDLRNCVKAKGYPLNAWLMYFGVRAWYWLKWNLCDGITYRRNDK